MIKRREPSAIAWLINRWRCMPMAELGYRIKQSRASQRVRRSLADTATAMQQYVPTLSAAFPLSAGLNTKPYMAEADAILAGDVRLFTEGQYHVGSRPDWNRNPRPDWAVTRDPSDDIKYVWELNRHLHWVRLAQAHLITHNPRYLQGLAAQVSTWLEQCPPLTGPNWVSSIELAIRLINWSVVWHMLGGWDGVLFKKAEGEQLRSRWLESIFAHCQFIKHNFSRYSSANNHLIGELAGLYIGASTWQFGDRSRQWAAQAKAELEREAVAQHFADGVNREQAFAYQAYTCECLTLVGIQGHRSGDPFSDTFCNALRRAYRFLRSIKDAGGNFPMVGDADDGAILRLEPWYGLVRSATMLSLGDAIFGENPSDQPPSDTAQWLLGDAGALFPAQTAESSTDWKFPDGGYFLFGSRFGERDEIKGMVDGGPLGYLGIAAHGHADALAIWLSIAGEECLIDPGTFTYGSQYKWRDYFRGTSAHNTVRVDGLDQSISGGRFMWTRKAKVTVEKSPTSPVQFDFAASHDGYMRLRDPVRHVRSIAYDDAERRLTVKDDISGKTPHAIEQFWHFAPDIQVNLHGNRIEARGKRFELHMQLAPGNLVLERIRGDENTPLGWYSPSYGRKEPTTVIRVRASASALSIETRFTIKLFEQTL